MGVIALLIASVATYIKSKLIANIRQAVACWDAGRLKKEVIHEQNDMKEIEVDTSSSTLKYKGENKETQKLKLMTSLWDNLRTAQNQRKDSMENMTLGVSK